MKCSIDDLMRKFDYDGKLISYLLGIYVDFVKFIRDCDNEFDLESKR